VRPGGSTVLNGSCYPRNADLNIVMTSDPVLLGTVKSDGNGAFSVTITIPANTSQGTHTITVSGAGASAALSLIVSGAFGVTGLSWDMAILGLALIAAGIIVLAGDRIGKQDLIEFA
jgi:5'-nucleotidase